MPVLTVAQILLIVSAMHAGGSWSETAVVQMPAQPAQERPVQLGPASARLPVARKCISVGTRFDDLTIVANFEMKNVPIQSFESAKPLVKKLQWFKTRIVIKHIQAGSTVNYSDVIDPAQCGRAGCDPQDRQRVANEIMKALTQEQCSSCGVNRKAFPLFH